MNRCNVPILYGIGINIQNVFVAMLRLVSVDEQGNWVRIPDGTAAVYAECMLVDENQSVGKPEKAEYGCRSNKLRTRESEDLQEWSLT